MKALQDADVAAVVNACLELYTSAMAGKAVRAGELRGLDALAALLVTPESEWRVDGLAQLHNICAELLDRFVTDGIGRSEIPKEDVRQLLGRWIGVDTSPMSVNGARTAVATGGATPSESLVRKWRRELRISPPVIELARERLAQLAELPPPDLSRLGELPIWESDPLTWPPSQDWIRLRDVLLTSRDLPRGLREPLRAYEDRLLLAARGYAGQRADEYLMAAVTPHPEPDLGNYILAPEHAWRWFRQRALRRWEVDYRITPPQSVQTPVTVEGPEKSVVQYRRRAAAAMQLALGQAVTRWKDVHGLLRHLYGLDDRMQQTARRMGLVEDLFLPDRTFGGPVPVRGGGDLDLLRAELPNDLETRVRGLTQLSGFLRTRLSRHDVAISLAEIYCDERAGISLEPSVDPAVLLELDLADHSVDWDMVSLSTTQEGQQLSKRFRRAIRMPRQTPFSVNSGLRLHRYRSEMVAATKRHEWRKATESGNVAWAESGDLIKNGKLTGIYAIECRQQIALGLAGVWVKQAEDCLLAVDERHLSLSYERYIIEALVWSRTANAMLELLTEDGLPAQRGENGRIGSVRWTAQTPTLLLRAQLAAVTATESGLCRRIDLIDPSGSPVGLGEADRLYLQMITNKYAGAGLTVQLAFWNALLHDDRFLPVTEPGTVSKDIERLDLLHCAPDDPQQSVQLDFVDVTTKLRQHSYNANFIGKLRKGARVYTYFDDIHPGFADWLTSWRAAGGG